MAGTRSKEKEKPVEDPPAPEPKPPELPTTKTSSSTGLEERTVVIYGAQGVGKSTLASQWAGGNMFFFNCAGELADIEVYQQTITSWADFRSYAWAISEAVKKKEVPYPGAVIDTGDVLGRYCAEVVRKRLGIAHESDLDYGKGWQALRDEFAVNTSKLAALPNFGLIYVCHAEEKEVKTRSAEYTKSQIRGVKSIREVMQDSVDLVLFIDFSETNENVRVIKTKPSRYWDAKERGMIPRLPAEIEWPIGENGWDIIKAAWEGE